MAKGVLSGVLAGTVVSVLGLGVVSLQFAPVQPAQVDTAPAGQPDTPVAGTSQDAAPAPVVSDTPPDAISAPDDPSDIQPVENAAIEDTPVPDAPAPQAPPTPEAPASGAPGDTAAPIVPPQEIVETPVETDVEQAPQEPAAKDAASAVEMSEPSADATTATADDPGSADETVVAEDTDAANPEAASDSAVAEDSAAADLPQSIPDLSNAPKLKSDPVAPIGDMAEGVTTNRLPTIEQPATNGEGSAAEGGPVLAGTSGLAIEQNAAVFSNPEGRPLMSVVLVDQGSARQALGDLDNLPFPVSFIVDTSAPDAAEAIAFYRENGAEVLIVPALPENATPTDAEVIFEAQSPLLDHAVGIFMDEESGFQGNSQLAAQIAEILVASGHGLVSEPQGLNTGHKTALKTGVAAGIVFRELDGTGEDSKVMRRFLDNAAFKAGQEDGVILLGQAQAETLQALIEWNLGNRAKSVAMAPISALLLGG